VLVIQRFLVSYALWVLINELFDLNIWGLLRNDRLHMCAGFISCTSYHCLIHSLCCGVRGVTIIVIPLVLGSPIFVTRNKNTPQIQTHKLDKYSKRCSELNKTGLNSNDIVWVIATQATCNYWCAAPWTAKDLIIPWVTN